MTAALACRRQEHAPRSPRCPQPGQGSGRRGARRPHVPNDLMERSTPILGRWIMGRRVPPIGGLGLAAFAGGVAVSRSYALGLAVVYAVVAIAGFLPQQFLGIIPIGGADIVLHTGTAVVALAAFMATRQPAARTA